MSIESEELKNGSAPKIYSEAFKKQVVKEFERGLFTKAELRRRYKIAGNSCIPRWLKKYGKFTYQDKLTIGRPMKDPQSQRIKELEAQLAKKEQELLVFKKIIEIAERELKVEIGKKVWFQAVQEINHIYKISPCEICRVLGYSKQAYYKRKSLLLKSDLNQEHLRCLIMSVRQKLPKTGGRKLHYMLRDAFKKHQIKIGRDKLFDFLREEYLLVPKVRRYYKTTNSKHWMRKYPNLTKEIAINRPEQIWVADITYLRTREKTHYLHLITDAYSKKIVGYNLSDNLMASSTLKALKMAVTNKNQDSNLIHHSDRGLQYCSKEYTQYLIRNNILISMTQNYDPYENAVAERVNGILKEEFGLFEIFENFENLKKQVQESILLYNQIRVHLSINMLTPNQAHLQNQVKLKTWKKLNRNKISFVPI
ncbi:IS3 family transposase [[Flexibacter] sp. ATCC 35103]|uniref:IS3 family transposase n=1 Tax=[Flexibacter] sp. ATCC 35103 TaxID=1937528 RepID=UPI000F4FCD12|nr:IS3 family transposase [[Flexibacter] sp. ATCC 35103]